MDNETIMVSSFFSKYLVESQPLSYHVAKTGLEQMMRYYALHLDSKGTRVNSIMPFTFLKEESKSFSLNNQPLLDLYEPRLSIGRICKRDAVKFANDF